VALFGVLPESTADAEGFTQNLRRLLPQRSNQNRSSPESWSCKNVQWSL